MEYKYKFEYDVQEFDFKVLEVKYSKQNYKIGTGKINIKRLKEGTIELFIETKDRFILEENSINELTIILDNTITLKLYNVIQSMYVGLKNVKIKFQDLIINYSKEKKFILREWLINAEFKAGSIFNSSPEKMFEFKIKEKKLDFIFYKNDNNTFLLEYKGEIPDLGTRDMIISFFSFLLDKSITRIGSAELDVRNKPVVVRKCSIPIWINSGILVGGFPIELKFETLEKKKEIVENLMNMYLENEYMKKLKFIIHLFVSCESYILELQIITYTTIIEMLSEFLLTYKAESLNEKRIRLLKKYNLYYGKEVFNPRHSLTHGDFEKYNDHELYNNYLILKEIIQTIILKVIVNGRLSQKVLDNIIINHIIEPKIVKF